MWVQLHRRYPCASVALSKPPPTPRPAGGLVLGPHQVGRQALFKALLNQPLVRIFGQGGRMGWEVRLLHFCEVELYLELRRASLTP